MSGFQLSMSAEWPSKIDKTQIDVWKHGGRVAGIALPADSEPGN